MVGAGVEPDRWQVLMKLDYLEVEDRGRCSAFYAMAEGIREGHELF